MSDIYQKKFERISELMASKGVPHEAFELLADIHADKFIKGMQHAVVDTVKGYVEGRPTNELNYLQRLRELLAKELELAAKYARIAELEAAQECLVSNGMADNKFDLTTPTDCSNAFGCPHFINGKPSF